MPFVRRGMTSKNRAQLIRPYDDTLHFRPAALCAGEFFPSHIHPSPGAGKILGEAGQSLQVRAALGQPPILGNVYVGGEGAVYSKRPVGGRPKSCELYGAPCASGV